MNDWEYNLIFGNGFMKPRFILSGYGCVPYKENNSNTFITKLKRFVDDLYFRKIINTYQQPMINRIHLFCDPDKINELINDNNHKFIKHALQWVDHINDPECISKYELAHDEVQQIPPRGNERYWWENN